MIRKEVDDKESPIVFADNMKSHDHNVIFWKIALENNSVFDKYFIEINGMNEERIKNASVDLFEFFIEFFF